MKTAAPTHTTQYLPPRPVFHPGLSTLTPSTLPSPRPQPQPHSSTQMSVAGLSTPLGDDAHLMCPEFFVSHSSDEQQQARLLAARLLGERGQSSDASARGSVARSNSALFALNAFTSQQHKREQEQLQRELQLRRQMQHASASLSQSPIPLLSPSRSNDDLQFSLGTHFTRHDVDDTRSRQHSRHSSLNSVGPIVEQKAAEPIVGAQEQGQLMRSSATPMAADDDVQAAAAHAEESKEQPMELVTAPSGRASSAWVEDAAPTVESASASDGVSASSVVSDAPHALRTAWRVLCSHPDLNRLARAHIDLLDVQMTAVSSALVDRHSERMAQRTPPLSDADRAAAAAQFNAALDHLGRSFCEAGERVVDLCYQRALRAAAVTAKNDLLYDQASPESSSHGSSSAASAEEDDQVQPKKRAKHSSEDASRGSAMDMNDETEDDDDEQEGPRRRKDRGGKAGRKAKREPKVKVEGDDGSNADEDEPAPKSKSGAKRKQRSPSSEAKGVFTEAAIAFLRKWLDDHLDDPYPDAEQKHQMSAETGLTYGQVQHWFINARMRYWRPLIAARKAELEASMKRDSQSSLSDLFSAATHAAQLNMDAAESKRQIKTESQVGQPAAASSVPPLPRSGRSYMLDPHRALPSLTHPTPGASGSASGASAAELRAASVLSLSMASSYQTPHSYVDSHPLSRGKYKSGGKNNKTAAAAAAAASTAGSKSRSRNSKPNTSTNAATKISIKQEPQEAADGE